MKKNDQYQPYMSPELDGRVKIPKDQYPEVRKFYKELGSMNRTADHYGVTKKVIFNILHPEKYQETLKKRRELKVHLEYYNKERRVREMRKYRAKKQELGIPKK